MQNNKTPQDVTPLEFNKLLFQHLICCSLVFMNWILMAVLVLVWTMINMFLPCMSKSLSATSTKNETISELIISIASV